MKVTAFVTVLVIAAVVYGVRAQGKVLQASDLPFKVGQRIEAPGTLARGETCSVLEIRGVWVRCSGEVRADDGTPIPRTAGLSTWLNIAAVGKVYVHQ